MKIGLLMNVLCNLGLEEALSYCKSVGIEMVEIGCGGFPGVHHCDPDILLADEQKFEVFQRTIEKSGLDISAFSCHGNPVHPVKEIAGRYDKIIRNGILMAEKMGVDTICCFSGCPGGEEGSRYPNWVTCAFPYEFVEVLAYQWEKVLIPYWKDLVAFANQHHVTKIALEMHPGFAVYNPETLLRLRETCGDTLGANFDPSHLIWQGIDCPTAIRKLEGAIYHFHAKDTEINVTQMHKNGFFHPEGRANGEAPFQFRVPGNGSGPALWSHMVAALIAIGYDGVMSIEHEDNSRGQLEGIRSSAAFLDSLIVREKRKNCWWKAPIQAYQKTFLPSQVK